MRGRTNLPKGVIYKEKETETTPLNLQWKPNALTTTDNLIKIIYEKGYFVILGDNGTVSYGTDGKYFVTKKIGDYTFEDIYYHNGKFYIVGYAGTVGVIAISENLKDWDIKTYQDKMFLGICHNGEYFILLAVTGTPLSMLCTADLDTFEATQVAPSCSDVGQWQFSYHNNRVVIAQITSGYATVRISSDGKNITTGTTQLMHNKKLIYANGYFLHSSGKYLSGKYTVQYGTSINGLAWSITSKDATEIDADLMPPKFCAAVYFNEYYVIFTADRTLLIMDDLSDLGAIKNSELKVITNSTVNDVAVSGTGIVAVCDGGEVYTASVDIEDREMEIIPGDLAQEIYLRKSDNIRKIKVRGKN